MIDSAHSIIRWLRPGLWVLVFFMLECVLPAVERTESFESELKRLMQLLDIPGLAVAVVKDGESVFREAYGWADIESKTAMSTSTLVEIASITKTMTSIVIGQLVDEGKISLDDPVVRYPFVNWFNPSRVQPDVTLRHVLSHTSQGSPLGTTYLYQGNRFNFVWGIFGSATPDSFQDALSKRVLQRLEMSDTFPQTGTTFTESHRLRVATPYRYEKHSGGPIPVEKPPSPEQNQVVPAAGLFSTLDDMTKYVIALQKRPLVQPDTWAMLQTPAMTNAQSPLPYAIGWAVQEFSGHKLVWHYGYGNGNSALIIRVPARKLAYVLLSNSGNVSGSTRWGYGDVNNSPFATAFVRHFVIQKARGADASTLNADVRALEPLIEKQVVEDQDTFVLREVFAEAAALSLMEGRNRDTKRAAELLLMLDRIAPESIRERGLTALDVLEETCDERLAALNEAISEDMLQRSASHPVVLLRSAKMRIKRKEMDVARDLLHRAADSTDYEDEIYTVDACLELGGLYLDLDPKKARYYFWRAIVLGSRIPADMSEKCEMATCHLREID